MGLEFLARVRRTTLWTSGIAALAAATYLSPLAGLAILLGAGWSIANLFLIEKLVVSLTGPERGGREAVRLAGLALSGMFALFAIGALLLVRLDPMALLSGFFIPFLVLTLKAASILVLESRFWKRLTASRWRAAFVVAAIVLGAWWLAAGGVGASQESHGTVTDSSHAPAQAAEPGAHGAATTESHGEGAEGEHAEQGPQKFPNVITFVTSLAPDAPWAHFLHHYEAILYSLFIGLLLCLLAFAASRNPQMIPRGLQNAAELVVEKLHDFIVGILGPQHGPSFVPFLGTLFIYILTMNLFGLVLFMDSPTSNLNITFALGLTVFVYAQYVGIRNLGLRGYVDHLLGSPRNLIGWLLVPLMLPIHVMGELAKPISLSCRLFGNIFGEDMLMVAFATLGISILAFANVPFGIPMQAFFFPLVLLTSALQALVFTVLSTIYFLLMLPHEEHGHEAEAQPAH